MNTTTIDLDHYIELREFKQAIMSGKVVRFVENKTDTASYYGTQYIEKDEVIDRLEKINEELKDSLLNERESAIREISKYHKENRIIEIKKERAEQKLEDIRNMNVWQFLKWKYQG